MFHCNTSASNYIFCGPFVMIVTCYVFSNLKHLLLTSNITLNWQIQLLCVSFILLCRVTAR